MRLPISLLVTTLAIAGCDADDQPAPQTPSGGIWIATRQGCGAWDAAPKPGEVADWTGACVDGFIQGQGTLTWRSLAVRTGSMAPMLAVTETFMGAMRRGKMDGEGVLERFDPATGRSLYVHTGHFAADVPEGPGTTLTADGYRFTGTYHNGQRSGPGLARWGDVASYDGMYRDGWMNGHGIAAGRRATIYDGNRPSGQRIQAFKGDWRFDGDFESGIPEEAGTLVLSGGSAPGPPSWTLRGRWIDGCLADATRQACIGRGRGGAPELDLLPLGHPAIARSWAASPIYPPDALRAGVGGHVTVDCYVTVFGVATSCDVAASTDHCLDAATLEMASKISWIPAATRDGAPIDDPQAHETADFLKRAPPAAR